LPIKQVHLQKATENESLASKLDLTIPSAPNWAIIMTFYAAVHYVGAYFFTQRQSYRLHIDRDSAIQRDSQIGRIWRSYERLKDASEFARYEDTFFTANHYQLMLVNLNSIKNVINPLI
jgi:hypothetical protein